MCGIAGIVGSLDDRGVVLRRMISAIAHRGPDGEGIWAGDGCALGHRRLAIIDLSAAGHQPMQDESGRVVISYNGEVYNFRELRSELAAKGHRFVSQSDTEVVLRLYLEEGERFLERLNGMFALALWDRERNGLLLARDTYGQKPLFWAEVGGALVFASEIKSLLKVPGVNREIDPAAIDSLLSVNVVPAPLTMYRQIHRLQPGVAIWAQPNGERRSWTFLPRRPTRETSGSFDDAVGRIDHALGRAVQRQLIADVPVGIFLSGGIDSTLILSKLAKLGGSYDAFTVTYDEDARSELPHAQAAARRFGAMLHSVHVGAHHFSQPEQLLSMFDEPFADVAAPAVAALAQAARAKMTVALTGDGGDEIFGGYETHILARHLHRIGSAAWPIKWVARASAAIPAGAGYRSRLRALKKTLALAGSGWSGVGMLRANLSPEERNEVLRPELRAALRPHDPYDALRPRLARGPLDIEALFDPFEDRMLGDLFLHKSDITTMAHGLEGRAPFLDQDLIAAAGELPRKFLVSGLRGKHILRTLAIRDVDGGIGRRRKTGFSPPLDLWLRGELSGLIDERLGDGALVYDFVQARAVRRREREHATGRANHRRLLWPLILLETFLQRERDAGGREARPEVA